MVFALAGDSTMTKFFAIYLFNYPQNRLILKKILECKSREIFFIENFLMFISLLSLPKIHKKSHVKNPFPWLSEAQDATGIAAFFERREKNYQNAGMLDDDLDEL